MRVDQFLTTLTIDGATLGVWDSHAGGAKTASGNRYRPGGNQRPISLGGRATQENLTLGRLVRRDLNDWDLLVRLHETRVGKAEAIASQRPMDDDGNPIGQPLVTRGKLVNVTPPDSNSNEDGEAIWTIEIEPDN